MTNKTNNLRFLLFLGNQKVVVMREQDSLRLYIDKTNKERVSMQRMAAALSSK